MDPISHAALGSAVAAVGASKYKEEIRAAILIGGFAALLPDLDVLIRSTSDPLLAIEYHRHFTHSIAFIPIGALIAYYLVKLVSKIFKLKSVVTNIRTYFYAFVGYASHSFLDSCTTYGTQVLWPFSNLRVAWGIIGIVDPLFTLIIIGLLVLAFVKRNTSSSKFALIFVFFYLSLGTIQRNRAENYANAQMQEKQMVLSERGCDAKPAPLTLFLWRTICETVDDKFEISAWHLGPFGKVKNYEGGTIAKFSIEKEAPWLLQNSRQLNDLKRFDWFSSGFIVSHPTQKNVIGDVRYSLLPSKIDPLWGIVLDPEDSSIDRATPFISFRSIKDGDFEIFLSMLLGH